MVSLQNFWYRLLKIYSCDLLVSQCMHLIIAFLYQRYYTVESRLSQAERLVYFKFYAPLHAPPFYCHVTRTANDIE